MRFRESLGEFAFKGRIRAGSLEEVVLNPRGRGWVKYKPGRWVRAMRACQVEGSVLAEV